MADREEGELSDMDTPATRGPNYRRGAIASQRGRTRPSAPFRRPPKNKHFPVHDPRPNGAMSHLAFHDPRPNGATSHLPVQDPRPNGATSHPQVQYPRPNGTMSRKGNARPIEAPYLETPLNSSPANPNSISPESLAIQEANAKQFILAWHKNGYTYSQLVGEHLDADILKRMYTELGLETTAAAPVVEPVAIPTLKATDLRSASKPPAVGASSSSSPLIATNGIATETPTSLSISGSDTGMTANTKSRAVSEATDHSLESSKPSLSRAPSTTVAVSHSLTSNLQTPASNRQDYIARLNAAKTKKISTQLEPAAPTIDSTNIAPSKIPEALPIEDALLPQNTSPGLVLGVDKRKAQTELARMRMQALIAAKTNQRSASTTPQKSVAPEPSPKLLNSPHPDIHNLEQAVTGSALPRNAVAISPQPAVSIQPLQVPPPVIAATVVTNGEAALSTQPTQVSPPVAAATSLTNGEAVLSIQPPQVSPLTTAVTVATNGDAALSLQHPQVLPPVPAATVGTNAEAVLSNAIDVEPTAPKLMLSKEQAVVNTGQARLPGLGMTSTVSSQKLNMSFASSDSATTPTQQPFVKEFAPHPARKRPVASDFDNDTTSQPSKRPFGQSRVVEETENIIIEISDDDSSDNEDQTSTDVIVKTSPGYRTPATFATDAMEGVVPTYSAIPQAGAVSYAGTSGSGSDSRVATPVQSTTELKAQEDKILRMNKLIAERIAQMEQKRKSKSMTSGITTPDTPRNDEHVNTLIEPPTPDVLVVNNDTSHSTALAISSSSSLVNGKNTLSESHSEGGRVAVTGKETHWRPTEAPSSAPLPQTVPAPSPAKRRSSVDSNHENSDLHAPDPILAQQSFKLEWLRKQIREMEDALTTQAEGEPNEQAKSNVASNPSEILKILKWLKQQAEEIEDVMARLTLEHQIEQPLPNVALHGGNNETLQAAVKDAEGSALEPGSDSDDSMSLDDSSDEDDAPSPDKQPLPSSSSNSDDSGNSGNPSHDASESESDYEPPDAIIPDKQPGPSSSKNIDDSGNPSHDASESEYEPPDAISPIKDSEINQQTFSSNRANNEQGETVHETQAVDKAVAIKPDLFIPYESPLTKFKSYRYHPEFTDNVTGGFRSLTYSHKIDPELPLCVYEVARGVCNDQQCSAQHFRSILIGDDEILKQIGAPNPGQTEEEKQKYVQGLRLVIGDLRQKNIKDATAVAAEIIAYRRRFLNDPSRVVSL